MRRLGASRLGAEGSVTAPYFMKKRLVAEKVCATRAMPASSSASTRRNAQTALSAAPLELELTVVPDPVPLLNYSEGRGTGM